MTSHWHVYSMIGAYVASFDTELAARKAAESIGGCVVWDDGGEIEDCEFTTSLDQHQRLMSGC
jgi:hypothetical protein